MISVKTSLVSLSREAHLVMLSGPGDVKQSKSYPVEIYFNKKYAVYVFQTTQLMQWDLYHQT